MHIKTAMPSRLRIKALLVLFAFGLFAQGVPSAITLADEAPEALQAQSQVDLPAEGP